MDFISRSFYLIMAVAGLLFCGVAQSATYSYDALGRVVSIQYENGTKVTYGYDSMGNRTETDIKQGTGSGGPDTFFAVLSVPSSVGRPAINLRSLANRLGYDGTETARITFIVPEDAIVKGQGGTESFPDGGVAIDTGDWPESLGNELTLKVSGKVYGGGGAGGNEAVKGNRTVYTGGDGGASIVLRTKLNVKIEEGGEIKGGGGGGGSGASSGIWRPMSPITLFNTHAGGAGGGGFPNGKAGHADRPGVFGTMAKDGTTSGGGRGSIALLRGGEKSPNGHGGKGGAAARPGSPGQASLEGYAGAAGGAAGAALETNGNNYSITNRGVLEGARRY